MDENTEFDFSFCIYLGNCRIINYLGSCGVGPLSKEQVFILIRIEIRIENEQQ